MAASVATSGPVYVDWHVYERDIARVEKQFEQLYEKLDRLADILEENSRQEKSNSTLLKAEWIKLLAAFCAGAAPSIVVALIANH